ncbi:MAG: alkaline phosphatase family protein [Candidatus Micrarchaeota archaeon]
MKQKRKQKRGFKKLIIVLDGVGDRPIKKFRGKSPLEAAGCKNLNALARCGRTGLAVVAERVAPESDVGVFAVLGYDPAKGHVARGALEAIGFGIKMKDGWCALRGNFATARGAKIIDRRAGRTLQPHEAKALAAEVSKKVRLTSAPSTKFTFKATVAHRCVLVLRAGRRLSGNVSNTDPAYMRVHGMGSAIVGYKKHVVRCFPLENSLSAEVTATLVNEFAEKSRRVLENSSTNKAREKKRLLPANIILLRDAQSELPKRKQMPNWTIIADMPLEVGIGRFLGMRIERVPETHHPERGEGLRERVKQTLAALRSPANEGVYVHIKGPDLPGHWGDPVAKRRIIKKIDVEFIGPLAKRIDWRTTRLLVTADHSTPCELKTHSADPVPILLVGAGIRAADAREWRERECFERGSVRCASSALRKMLEK